MEVFVLGQTVGLYLHIPFCRSKCAYCDFYSLPTTDESAWDEYLAALTQHIRETAPSMAKHVLDTVYFGGGTPSLLGPKRLGALLDLLGKLYPLSSSPEITLEGNPDSLDPKTLKKLKKQGFNRLSIGVQSFDDDMLRLLGRPHTAAQAEEAFQAARAAGFGNLSVDLLYGLPGQTRADWGRTLEKALSLKPEHLSCYGLKLEEGTPLHLMRHEYAFPDDDLQADMYLDTAEALKAAGFVHYEISNFCRPGYECRHNMKYWTVQPYVGLGPAAHSDCGGRRWSYVKDLKTYIDGIHQGDALVAEMEDIPPLERAGEYLMLRLRTAHGISGNEYTRDFRVSFDAIERRLELQESRGLAARSDGRWRLTEKGFLVSNQVIGDLLEQAETNV
ncbi:MAG: radical SAM family heme chaperone HemW [Oscillospiraceae bacterium]|jgi:oxygen-independent coproporphyrinogen-3 oxidase|nr:radical SAM family heme chaperone HemW [Oscillospiraceae bacterium]